MNAERPPEDDRTAGREAEGSPARATSDLVLDPGTKGPQAPAERAPLADGEEAHQAPTGASGDVSRHVAEPWLDALLAVARHYRVESSPERAKVEMDWLSRDVALDELIEHLARQLGLVAVFDRFVPDMLDPWRLPLIADLGDGQVGVIEQVGQDGSIGVRVSGEQGLVTLRSRAELIQRVRRVLLVKPLASVPDARVDDYIQPYRPNWLWSLLLRDWPRYVDVMAASLLTNLLALASMLFSMQVYDRVIPAQSEHTLWVLFGGVTLAVAFSFALRLARTHIADLVGKRADLRVSDRVFGHALRIRNDARPVSTGSFIAQVRELEQVRELVASTTINAVVDMPFFLLFAFVMWAMGGSLVWVPLAAVPLLVIPGMLVQRPLARLSQEGMREASVRSAMLVEAVQGIEDIKLLRAEPRFQSQWNHINEVAAGIATRQRFVSGMLMGWTQDLQTLVYAGVLVVGAYQVMAGQISTGVLIACSIMSSRMIAPLSQLSVVATRWQQAKVARRGLDELMKKPVDQPERSEQVHRPLLRGDYELGGVGFRYVPDAPAPVVGIERLAIRAGEKVALLGRNGAGKSTLLQLLAGMQVPQQGQVMLDGTKLPLIDPSDVRRDVALLGQNATLFFGTVRENITMGLPHASEDELMRALHLSGAAALVGQLGRGLDHPIREGGIGLSGGQRQTLLLARTLIREPRVLLLDEPTAWLDEASERQLIGALQPWLRHRTLVVATHRPAVLRWVDRVIVLDGGRVVADGPRDQVLAPRPAAPPPAAPPPPAPAVSPAVRVRRVGSVSASVSNVQPPAKGGES